MRTGAEEGEAEQAEGNTTRANAMKDLLKCRFCGFTCRKWVGRKGQTPRSGFAKLRQHILDYHEEEAVAALARENQDTEFEDKRWRTCSNATGKC